MAQPSFSTLADDDLPRTLRREKQAREREREAAEAEARARQPVAAAVETAHGGDTLRYGPSSMPSDGDAVFAPAPSYGSRRPDPFETEMSPAVVRRLQIPFVHLMMFFLTAVVAAIPALILLGLMLYGAGQVLKLYFPWIIQTEILIRFPN